MISNEKSDLLNKYKEQTEIIVEVIKRIGNFQCITITDMTIISDFNRNKDISIELSNNLNIEVKKENFIWEIALKLFNQQNYLS